MNAVAKGIQYFQDHTQSLFEQIERKALRIGEKCDQYMDNASPRKKYMCEVFLRVPLIFIIHQWLLLSPYSNYWIIEAFLFIIRYGVATLLVGAWPFNCGVLLQLYTMLTIDMAVMWLTRIDYWTHQDELCGTCHDMNARSWSDVTESWRTPVVCSILLQVVYICYRPGAFIKRAKERVTVRIYVALLATVVPNILSVLGIFPSFMSELSYWIESTLSIAVCVFEVVSTMGVDISVDKRKIKLLTVKRTLTYDEQTRLKYKRRIQDLQQRIGTRRQAGNFGEHLPGKWFIRDIMLAFGTIYILLSLLIEITIYQRQITSMLMLDTLFDVSTIWCTTHVVVISVSFGLGLMSNLCVALCQMFLTSEINIIEALDASIGGIVQVSALITFTEANILSLEYTEKLEAMKIVIFFSVYVIVFQTLHILELKIFHAVNSGISPGVLFYLRVGILTGLLLVAPSLSTYIVSKYLDINPWLLFFASGNCTLILETFSLLLECALISLTWHTAHHLSRLEDLIHYLRVSKSVGLVILCGAQNYFRYICPLFKGWWFLRFCLTISSFVFVAGLLVMFEVNRYKGRSQLISLFAKLPDVTFQPAVSTDDNGEENVCAICFSAMADGKTLPCKHTFHKDCLRRWFQVKAVCPLCKMEIK